MFSTWTANMLCSFGLIFKLSFVAAGVNCCSLNETELNVLNLNNTAFSTCSRVFSRMVFRSTSFPGLNAKCDTCLEGTCRVDMDCYCPSTFLATNFPVSLKERCAYSFGASWPQSIGKQDTTWRSCLKKPPSTRTEDNCCSLTEEQLEERVGTSSLCPTRNSSVNPVAILGAKFDLCPFGACRVGLRCYCPKDFLQSVAYHELCRPSFTKKWNQSVELDDRHWRSCARPTPSQRNTFDNCCALSIKELEIRIGTSNACPLFQSSISSYLKSLEKECDPCPFGTCRAGSRCFCPADFLNSDDQKGLCRESFGFAYPESVGRPDTLCPDNPKPEILSSSPGTPGVTPAPIPSSTTETPQQGDKEADSSDGLTTAEVVGIVTGIVTGIIATIGVFVGWFVCIRQEEWKKKKSSQTNNEYSSGRGFVFETSSRPQNASNETFHSYISE